MAINSAKKVTVELFYDLVSPYTYFGFEALTRCNRKWENMDLKLKPVFLGGIFASTGNKSPAMVPAKGVHMPNDCRLLAKHFNMPFKFPSNFDHLFKKGALSGQRLLASVGASYPTLLEPLSRDLFLRTWARDEDITSLETLKSACLSVGLSEADAKLLVDSIGSAEAKNQLKDNTKDAVEAGAFGVPTFVVHTENGPVMLFGCDRMFILADLLKQDCVGPMNEMNQSKL